MVQADFLQNNVNWDEVLLNKTLHLCISCCLLYCDVSQPLLTPVNLVRGQKLMWLKSIHRSRAVNSLQRGRDRGEQQRLLCRLCRLCSSNCTAVWMLQSLTEELTLSEQTRKSKALTSPLGHGISEELFQQKINSSCEEFLVQPQNLVLHIMQKQVKYYLSDMDKPMNAPESRLIDPGTSEFKKRVLTSRTYSTWRNSTASLLCEW